MQKGGKGLLRRKTKEILRIRNDGRARTTGEKAVIARKKREDRD